jgi:hypothetical protein
MSKDKPSVHSGDLLADGIAAVRALMSELDGYTSVHGEDEEDANAMQLGREFLQKANPTGQPPARLGAGSVAPGCCAENN